MNTHRLLEPLNTHNNLKDLEPKPMIPMGPRCHQSDQLPRAVGGQVS